jgi:hypothetical protein
MQTPPYGATSDADLVGSNLQKNLIAKTRIIAIGVFTFYKNIVLFKQL